MIKPTKKPTKKHIAYARSVIGALRAFMAGRPVQRRSRAGGHVWRKFDLSIFISGDPVEYRAKPARKAKA